MQYVASILLPNTNKYIRHEVTVDCSHLAPWVRAYLKACRIAKKAAKLHHCYAYVYYKEAGCPMKTVKEFDFTDLYDA